MNYGDIGITKNFPFKEHYRIQFRWEMFNAFNHANFDLPNGNPASSAFGTITSTLGYNSGAGGGVEQQVFGVPARQMQLAVKFYF
jgi:hypothetical protein